MRDDIFFCRHDSKSTTPSGKEAALVFVELSISWLAIWDFDLDRMRDAAHSHEEIWNAKTGA